MTVTFKSECYQLEAIYADEDFNKLEFWTWPEADADSFFNTPYKIRDDLRTAYIPIFTPTMPSGFDVFVSCGFIKYDISNPDGQVFNDIMPFNDEWIKADATCFDVYTNDINKADIVNFSKTYNFALSVRFEKYDCTTTDDCIGGLDGSFAYPSNVNDDGVLNLVGTELCPRNYPLIFTIADPCMTLTYETDRPFVVQNEGRLENNIISYAVMDGTKTILVQMHEHKRVDYDT